MNHHEKNMQWFKERLAEAKERGDIHCALSIEHAISNYSAMLLVFQAECTHPKVGENDTSGIKCVYCGKLLT